MLDQKDISKFQKPLLISLGSKAIIFLIVLIFLAARNITGFSQHNIAISHCDNYINLKNSQYQDKMLMTQFLMTLFGLIASVLSLTIFGSLLIVLRKQQKQQLTQKIRLSQNRLRIHFILTFIESICTINIFSRSIQKINEQNFCSLSIKDDFIVVLSFSVLELCTLGITMLILFKLAFMMQEKEKSLKEFSFYSDQITLQQNLLFNKSGYIKELLKLDDYSSRSSSLKDQIVKTFPSGYKKKNNDLSPTRQIIYKLRGGNKTSKVIKQQQDTEFQSMRNQQQKGFSEQGHQNRLNLLTVNQKMYDQNPNDQNYQNIELALNVIELNVKNKVLQDLKDRSNQQSQQEQSQEYNDRPLQMRKGLNGFGSPKKQKNAAVELKLEEQLRQKFNLTPNLENRKKNVYKRNQQNIDDYGNYYFVDVDRIKKKSKLLNFQKLQDQASNVDFNTLYAKAQWNPKQKRVSKKHEKYVKDYLNKLQQIKKKEMLIEEEQQQSSYSESFEESQLSSELSNSQNSQEQVDVVQVPVIDPNTGQTVEVKLEKKKKQKNSSPKLYLHLKKKKRTGLQNKLKLYEDEEGFYEDEGSNENQQSGANSMAEFQRALEFSPNGQKASKEHQLEKAKHDDKLELSNKHLETQEARMLRFIRRKYLYQEANIMQQQMHELFTHQHQGTGGYNQHQQNNQGLIVQTPHQLINQ